MSYCPNSCLHFTILYSGNFSIFNDNTFFNDESLIFYRIIIISFFMKRVTGPFALRCLILTTRLVRDFSH